MGSSRLVKMVGWVGLCWVELGWVGGVGSWLGWFVRLGWVVSGRVGFG